MTVPAARSAPLLYSHRHILGIEGLSPVEITGLLDLSESYVEQSRRPDKKDTVLRGRTVINLFFETSTRTRTSFELAAKRLGADVINMSVAASAIKKGETLLDTATTLNAMRPDVLVVRHPDSGAVNLLSQKVDCSVINGGDGSHEHPTQALLDALTIRRRRGKLEGLLVAICGDIRHSRVARSNIHLLTAMGARVRVIAPPTLLAPGIDRLGVEVFTDMRSGPQGLRHRDDAALQAERMQVAAVDPRILPLLGLDYDKLASAKPGRPHHASGADEPRRRDRQRGGRRHRPQPDPRRSRWASPSHGLPDAHARCGPAACTEPRGCPASWCAAAHARLLDPAASARRARGNLVQDELIAEPAGEGEGLSRNSSASMPAGTAWRRARRRHACSCASRAKSTRRRSRPPAWPPRRAASPAWCACRTPIRSSTMSPASSSSPGARARRGSARSTATAR
jgi:aspartate carbamoyltransferase catalytic subunit